METLQVGDAVFALNDTVATGCWVGLYKQTLRNVDAARVAPVRISAGALAGNMPHRDLYVSPDHAIFIENVLVPAALLLNGRAITQPRRTGWMDYYHVELEKHDVIFAEGAATESFMNLGNRRELMSGQAVIDLHGDDSKTWEDACAPLVLAGPTLDRIRSALEQRADQINFSSVDEQLVRAA